MLGMTPSKHIVLAAVFVVVLFAAGCANGGSDEPQEDELFGDPIPESDPLTTEEDLRDWFEGLVTEPYDLLVGTCFNQYRYLDRNDLPAQLTTAIGCTRPHNAQVYAIVIHDAPPGASYPGEEAVNDWGRMQCYERFEPFVGLVYELSDLDIGMITPSRTDWEGEDYRRRISCYVFDRNGTFLEADAEGRGR